MPKKPVLAVNEVWVLQLVTPYDGSEIINVVLDVDEVQREHTTRGPWQYDVANDYYYTDSPGPDPYFLLTRHPILVTRRSKHKDSGPKDERLAEAWDKGWEMRNKADKDGNPYR